MKFNEVHGDQYGPSNLAFDPSLVVHTTPVVPTTTNVIHFDASPVVPTTPVVPSTTNVINFRSGDGFFYGENNFSINPCPNDDSGLCPSETDNTDSTNVINLNGHSNVVFDNMKLETPSIIPPYSNNIIAYSQFNSEPSFYNLSMIGYMPYVESKPELVKLDPTMEIKVMDYIKRIKLHDLSLPSYKAYLLFYLIFGQKTYWKKMATINIKLKFEKNEIENFLNEVKFKSFFKDYMFFKDLSKELGLIDTPDNISKKIEYYKSNIEVYQNSYQLLNEIKLNYNNTEKSMELNIPVFVAFPKTAGQDKYLYDILYNFFLQTLDKPCNIGNPRKKIGNELGKVSHKDMFTITALEKQKETEKLQKETEELNKKDKSWIQYCIILSLIDFVTCK